MLDSAIECAWYVLIATFLHLGWNAMDLPTLPEMIGGGGVEQSEISD